MLALVVLGAMDAAAATKGTTVFTCHQVTPASWTGGFSKEHCTPADAVSSNASFEHSAVASNTLTYIQATNAKTGSATLETTPVRLKQIIAGVELELVATGVEAPGLPWVENRVAASGEHYIHSEGELTFSGVTIAKPAGKGCKVFRDLGGLKGIEGHFTTNPLTTTTQGQGDFFKLEAALGFKGVFATFFIECTTKVPAVEGTWEITGSLKCPTNGATVICQHSSVTEQSTLKGKGSKAGLEAALTLSGRDPGVDAFFTPLSFTTVETP
jgi:hypothetical protein